MFTPNSQFYVVGGTVNPDSPSYVVRQADQELYDRLLAAEFCYVLTSRQMGKSSLMARTARRLTEEAKIHTAIVDLTQIGTQRDKLSAEQWYYGIAHRILREVGLRDVNLNEWWQSRSSLSGLQRLTEFFRDLLLERVEGQIVIFIDEIDSTVSLPFTDDFFAAIRACHNARATDAAYNRLSFVLLGVASPSDLVKDATRTPFNVGQRIELTDFTAEEVTPLAAGLSANTAEGEQILARILDWTGGHPYLTQKLCGAMRALGDDGVSQYPDREGGGKAQDVDSLIEHTLLSQTASREDSNLNFVRDWLKGNKKLGVKVFKLYRRIRRGKPIADAPRSPVQNHLKLSGLVSLRPDKTLHVRNRVYERIFTDQWAKTATPVDWNRRLAVASVATLMLSIGFWYAVWNPRQYVAPLQNALDDYPGRYYDALHRFPWYAGKANELMAQFWDRRASRDETLGNHEEALLERLQAMSAKSTKIRVDEVARLVGSDYQNLFLTFRHRLEVNAVTISADGRRVWTASRDQKGGLWDTQTGKLILQLSIISDDFEAVAFSPDSKRIVIGYASSLGQGETMIFGQGEAIVFDTETGQLVGKLTQSCGRISVVAYSPDGKQILVGTDGGLVQIWDAQANQPIGKPIRPGVSVNSASFSPDGKRVVTGSSGHTAQIWDIQTGRATGKAMLHDDDVSVVAFGLDGNLVVTGTWNGIVQIWNAETSQPTGGLMRQDNYISSVAFSPDGKLVIVGSWDGTARVWDAQTSQPIGKPFLHTAYVTGVAFSPDGKLVVISSGDGTARMWNIQSNQSIEELLQNSDPAELLLDWQRRLGLKFDPSQNYKLVPIYSIGTDEEPDDPNPR